MTDVTRPRISDAQRRLRLARRHALAPPHRVADPVTAARSVVALHATEAASIPLQVLARTTASGLGDVDRALYEERSLVRQLAMRRTLFAFPRELLPAALSSASARVEVSFVNRVARAVVEGGVTDDGPAWIVRACAEVERAVAEAGALSNSEIRAAVPMVRGQVDVGTGKWGRAIPISPWICTLLTLRGRLTRGVPVGDWRNPRPRWQLMEDWLGETPLPMDTGDAYSQLVRRWLERYGPGTLDDIVWWLGATKGIVRTALARLEAVEVDLDDDVGYVLPGDESEEDDVGEWAALLPTLDATTMGWKGRGFYLDPADVPYLFDTNGNAGTTAWWNGRIVGCWAQDVGGAVRVVTRHELPRSARRALDAECARLTDLLGGAVVTSVYTTRQMRGQLLP